MVPVLLLFSNNFRLTGSCKNRTVFPSSDILHNRGTLPTPGNRQSADLVPISLVLHVYTGVCVCWKGGGPCNCITCVDPYNHHHNQGAKLSHKRPTPAPTPASASHLKQHPSAPSPPQLLQPLNLCPSLQCCHCENVTLRQPFQ